jgi:hypothetical protein
MKTLRLFLGGAAVLCFLAQNVFPQADIQVDSITTSPTTISAGVAPDQVTLLLDNLGPDTLPILPSTDSLVIEYRFSSDTDPIGTNAILLTNILASVGGGLPPGSYEFDYDPLSCSDLVIPPSFKGTNGYYFVYVTPYMDTDPNVANNLAMSACVTVVPVTSTIYTFFTQQSPASSDFQLVSSRSFSYNSGYGNSWILDSTSSGFTEQFVMQNAGRFTLHVRHLSSLYSACSGHGYSPVSIYCNGLAVAKNYDPAASHGGVHAYVDDFWTINVQAGTNTLQWQAGQLCSQYWIQMMEILPLAPVFSSIQYSTSSITLGILGDAANGGMIQTSTNLSTWTNAVTVPSFKSNYSLVISNDLPLRWRFFRLMVF